MSEGSEYRERLAEHILQDVFRDLWFPNKKMRNLLYETYVMNIPAMNKFIMDTQTDIRTYYYGIKQILLQTSGIKIRRNRFEKQR